MRRLALLGFVVGTSCAQGSSRPLIDNDDAAVLPADAPSAPRDIGSDPLDATPPLDATEMPIDAAPMPPDACVPTTVELLANPVFDLSPAGVNWVEQPIAASLALVTNEGFAADTAPYKAWMGGVAGEDFGGANVTDVLYQDVVIPPLTTNLVLTFKYVVGTQDSTTVPYDTGSVAATQTNGTVITSILSLDNTTVTGTAWTLFTHTFAQNLSGQTIRIRMTSTNDTFYASNFFFDTFSLKATHGCP